MFDWIRLHSISISDVYLLLVCTRWGKIAVLSYIDDCVYCYTSKAIGKWFVDSLGKICHVNLLGYAHWFMPIIISKMKDHYISVDEAIYAISIVAKYLDTATFKTSTNFYKTNLLAYIIFTKDDVSTSDEQVEKLTRKFNICYRACIGSLIHLLYTRLYLIFAVHKLAKFLSNLGKVHFEWLVNVLRYIRENKILGLNHYDDMKYAPFSDLLRQAIINTKNQLMVFSDSSWQYFQTLAYVQE